MVLTRSRTNSPGHTSVPGPDTESAPLHSHASPTQSSQPGSSEVPPALTPSLLSPTPVVMTDQQLAFLLSKIGGSSAPQSMMSTGNFARCTARFDGGRQTDVVSFLDAIEIYKECVNMDDTIAIRGLPMLLTGLAATWWQGVKHTVITWTEAVNLIRQTYGPRLPPHKIYRNIFHKEQGEESTDVFVCRIRALIAQLPPNTIPEDPVQLDMVYGLMHRRIREKVARTSFSSFNQLLEKTRAVEDLLDESQHKSQVHHHPTSDAASHTTVVTVPPAPSNSTSNTTCNNVPARMNKKTRPFCGYCKIYGHEIDSCNKRSKAKRQPDQKEASPDHETGTIVCFGCGTPGVIRSNCPTCMKKSSITPSTSFQSVSAVGTEVLDTRERPKLNIDIFGKTGSALLDTGAKQSIASNSLTAHLIVNGQTFDKVETTLKFADGSTRLQLVDVCYVDVTLQGVIVPTLFIVLPGANETLLGMNFIKDAGMTLDFVRNRYTLRESDSSYDLTFESGGHELVCSSIGLRESEGTLVTPPGREDLSKLLEQNSDIFGSGGVSTPYALHRIDTGNSLPTAVPPYRVSRAKEEINRAEIDVLRRTSTEIRAAHLEDPDIKGVIADGEVNNATTGWTDRGYYLSQGVNRGKCARLLTHCTGKADIVHNRKKRRPPKSKSPWGPSCDLEGEDIALPITLRTVRPARMRRPPPRLLD